MCDKATTLALVDQSFTNPYTTAARAAVNTLQERHILTEITGRAWGKTYVALPILRIISPEEAAAPTDAS